MSINNKTLQTILNEIYKSPLNADTREILRYLSTNISVEFDSVNDVLSGIFTRVETFVDLPLASTEPNSIFFVATTTSRFNPFTTTKWSGLYKSDGVDWAFVGIDIAAIQSLVDNLSNEVTPRLVDSQIVVKTASDLLNIDSTKVYVIDGKIDMGSVQIEVPSGGFFYKGQDYFVSSLFSTANNYTMFVNAAGQSAGNVRGTNVEHYATGTNSRIFNLDNQGNFGAIEFNSCNFGTFSAETTEIGELTDYRQLRTSDAAFIRIADGITFNGTWAGGIRLAESIILAPVSTSVLFKEGVGLVFNDSVRSDLNGLSIGASDVVFDFVDTNFLLDWGFNLDGARFPIGSNAIPNTPSTSTKRYFRDCRGIQNTFPGGDWNMTSQIPTLLTVGTLAQANGDVTYNGLVHFSGGPLNINQLIYNSNVAAEYIVTGNIVIDGGANDQVDVVIRQFDSSTGVYINLKSFSRNISNVVGSIDVAYYQIAVPCELDVNDRVEVWLRNNTDNSSATMLNGSFLRIDGR